MKKTVEITGPDSPVTSLRGIGPQRAAAYAKLGVNKVSDLIYHIPRAYENRGDIMLLDDCPLEGGKASVVLTVSSIPTVTRLRGRMTVTKFKATDDSGVCDLVFFNQPFLKQVFALDSVWRFYGPVEVKKGRGGVKRYSMSSPSYERFDPGTPLPDFFAVYPLTEGISQKQLAGDIGNALEICENTLEDTLPDKVRIENGLCTLSYALKNIHNPEDYAALSRAKKRLVFDELFMFSMIMARRGKHKRNPGAFPCSKQNISPLLKLLPYDLTNAQKEAVRDIAGDLKSDIPMSRILIGDVGCGKTAVAACAIYIAVMSGRQAALMAPTEILARQHYADLSELFGKLGIECALLVGSTPAAEKRKIKNRLSEENPEKRLNLVIGTHALISDGVDFSALSLVITDEQHRFGVNQRAALASKAEHAHVLALSATPIPRSLALALYGDLDITKINEMPPGRQKVDTHLANESMRDRINGFISRTVADGGQVYIVCPSIDEPDENGLAAPGEVSLEDITESGIKKRPPLKAAKVYAENLRSTFPELTVALIHGKMKADEKEAVMTGFAAGDIDILVSTTVIEVGVNVPNATLMIVENAERFGLSQLHQLRGRVGRGNRKSYCVLISDDESESAKSRLAVMATTSNGFEIAEADLKNRGPGDFVGKKGSEGIRQSGGLKFRFADLCGDASLFATATEAAHAILNEDPELSKYGPLKRELIKLTENDTVTD